MDCLTNLDELPVELLALIASFVAASRADIDSFSRINHRFYDEFGVKSKRFVKFALNLALEGSLDLLKWHYNLSSANFDTPLKASFNLIYFAVAALVHGHVKILSLIIMADYEERRRLLLEDFLWRYAGRSISISTLDKVCEFFQISRFSVVMKTNLFEGALIGGNSELVMSLLNDIFTGDYHRPYALMAPIQGKSLTLWQSFIDHFVTLIAESWLFKSNRKDTFTIIMRLHACGFCKIPDTMVRMSTRYNSMEFLRYCLESGGLEVVPVPGLGKTDVYVIDAIEGNNLDMTRYLIEVHKVTGKYLQLALSYGNVGLARYFMDRERDVEKYNEAQFYEWAMSCPTNDVRDYLFTEVKLQPSNDHYRFAFRETTLTAVAWLESKLGEKVDHDTVFVDNRTHLDRTFCEALAKYCKVDKYTNYQMELIIASSDNSLIEWALPLMKGERFVIDSNLIKLYLVRKNDSRYWCLAVARFITVLLTLNLFDFPSDILLYLITEVDMENSMLYGEFTANKSVVYPIFVKFGIGATQQRLQPLIEQITDSNKRDFATLLLKHSDFPTKIFKVSHLRSTAVQSEI